MSAEVQELPTYKQPPLLDQALVAAKLAVASIDGVVVGSCKAAADEMQRHPEKLAETFVETIPAGAAFGLLGRLNNRWVNCGLAFAGIAGANEYARDIVSRANADASLANATRAIADAKTWNEFSQALPAFEASAGLYGWEIGKNCVVAGIGFLSGGKLANELSRTGVFGNKMQLATAAAESSCNIKLPHSETATQDFVLFKRKFQYKNGDSCQLNDDGTGSYTRASGEKVQLKHKPVSNGLDLVYRPQEDAAKTLQSIRMIGSAQGDFSRHFWLDEFLKSKEAPAIIKRLPGTWEPEWSTHRMIELRSPDGRIVNLKDAYERELCPFLLQRRSTFEVGAYELESLPHFTRPFSGYKDVQPVLNTIERGGWYTTDGDWHNFGRLKNGFVVSTNPDPRVWMNESGWGELNHLVAAKTNKWAVHRLIEAYGKDHPVVAATWGRVALHEAELPNGLIGGPKADQALKSLEKSGQYWEASELAKKLFYTSRNASNRGMNEAMIEQAMKYFKTSQTNLEKHFEKNGY